MRSEIEVADLYAWSQRERERASVLREVSRDACAAARDMVSRCAERRIRHEHRSVREAQTNGHREHSGDPHAFFLRSGRTTVQPGATMR